MLKTEPIRIELGDQVKDPISNWEGIAVCRHQYLQGCDRIAVQPKQKKDGTLYDAMCFDEPQLIVIKKRVFKKTAVKTNPGGPAKYPDTPR